MHPLKATAMKSICNTLENVSWVKAEKDTFIHHHSLKICTADVSLFSAVREKIIHWLDEEEQKRMKRFVFQREQNRYLAAHACLRVILGLITGCLPEEVQYSKNDFGKPFLAKPKKKIFFNLSYSGEKFIIAVSEKNQVGIDMERIRKDFDFKEITEVYFSWKERAAINSAENPSIEFAKMWSRKEALLKSVGTGLIDDLRRIEVLDGGNDIDEDLLDVSANEEITSFDLDNEYMAAIACPGKEKISFAEIDQKFLKEFIAKKVKR